MNDNVEDPELAAMTVILAALLPLDDKARYRVLQWAHARYEVP